jgi:hypothetical protein
MACAFALLSAGVMAQEGGKPIDYDTFCKLPDQQAKKIAFSTTTSESRGNDCENSPGALARCEPDALGRQTEGRLAELIKSITSDSYGAGPQGEEARVKTRAIIANVERLFTREDVMAMQFTEACIPKK